MLRNAFLRQFKESNCCVIQFFFIKVSSLNLSLIAHRTQLLKVWNYLAIFKTWDLIADAIYRLPLMSEFEDKRFYQANPSRTEELKIDRIIILQQLLLRFWNKAYILFSAFSIDQPTRFHKGYVFKLAPHFSCIVSRSVDTINWEPWFVKINFSISWRPTHLKWS